MVTPHFFVYHLILKDEKLLCWIISVVRYLKLVSVDASSFSLSKRARPSS